MEINLFKYFNKFTRFDEVTNFRLKNSFLTAIGFSLISPIIILLKGTLLLAWVISVFSIFNMLAVKSNDYFVNNYSLSEIYKLGTSVHLLFTIGTLLYFYNPLVMIWFDSIMVIIDVAIFSSYSILLNNYLSDNYNEYMKDFQIIRNSSWADGALIGLVITTSLTFFFPISYAIGFCIMFNILFSIRLVLNWNFFSKI